MQNLSMSSELNTPPAPRSPDGRVTQDDERDVPLQAPLADRRRGSMSAQMAASTSNTHTLASEVMFVREYDRGRELRTTAIQGPEIVSMLQGLIGENQVLSKHKVRACLCYCETAAQDDLPLI